jgi:hypothetical protein
VTFTYDDGSVGASTTAGAVHDFAGLPVRVGGVGPGAGELVVPGMEIELLAGLGAGAAGAYRTAVATPTERAEPRVEIGTVCPPGQDAVRAGRSMSKSSMVNAPSASVIGRIEIGLMVWMCPAASRTVRVWPDP